MSKTFTSQPSRQANAIRERSVNRRVPLNQQAGTSSRTVGTSRTRAGRSVSNMNQQNSGQFGGLNGAHNTGQQNNAAGTAQRLQSPTRTATYAGAYTMIPPNEKKREQVSKMAQEETQAYEQYKQAKAVKHVSHVGTVGGGKVTEEQVRKAQAQALRRQKLDRLKRQEEQRYARRNVEEAEIEKKKAEARRKAEQNAIRNATVPPPEEIRSKREAFLSQLENQSSASAASIPPQRTPHAQPPRQTAAQAPVRQSKPAGGFCQASRDRY